MKEIYFYVEQYPEFEIEKIIVNSEEFVVCKDYKYLNGIYINYDINTYQKTEDEKYVHLYTPYEGIYAYDNIHGNQVLFSYNLDLIKEWRNEDIKRVSNRLEERLNKLNGYKNKSRKLLSEGIESDPEDLYLAEIESKANNYDKLLSQQKELIKCLQEELNVQIQEESINCETTNKRYILEGILQKCKKIVGVLDV